MMPGGGGRVGPPCAAMHILIPDGLHDSGTALLQAEGWTTDARTGRARDALLTDARHAVAVIVRSATKVDGAVMDAAPGLRVVARAGVGVDTIDLDAARQRGVAVLNAPEATTTSVAELALAGLLCLARPIAAADHSMKQGRWEKARFSGRELGGATLGVVGCGRIGRRVAALAAAFGMHVLGADPMPIPPDAGIEAVDLDTLCARADYISLHAPATPATRHLLDAARLARCRRGVRLVNTSRGELIDEAALLAALDSGQVGGAALDVFDPEPPASTALVSHPLVVATPHIAASTAEAQARVGLEVAQSVRDFLRDGVIRNAVVPPPVR